MPPTSTVTRRRVRRHPLFRFGGPLLAAALAVPVGGLAITWGGSSGDSGDSLAAVVSEQRPGGLLMPDRASRSAPQVEEPPPSTTSTTGLVEITQVAEERVIPVPKELRDDPALPQGETRVEADGSPGVERVVFEVTRLNGRTTAKRKLSSEIITPAKPRVVYVGRGGGRGAPTDEVAEEIPLKLRLAAEEEAGAAGPAVRRFAASAAPGAGEGPGGDATHSAPEEPKRTGGQQEGKASWYHHKPGTCAHRTLPKGTVVKVTNLKNGKTANCTVADRGPFVAGRVIDLERGVFMSIADSPGQGVIRVRIEW